MPTIIVQLQLRKVWQFVTLGKVKQEINVKLKEKQLMTTVLTLDVVYLEKEELKLNYVTMW